VLLGCHEKEIATLKANFLHIQEQLRQQSRQLEQILDRLPPR
jgi:hypothetical protein